MLCPLVEGAVEHHDDLGRLVVDDLAGRAIPEHRNAVAVVVAGVGALVGLRQVFEPVDRIARGARGLAERPAFDIANRIDYGEPDDLLESLQRTHGYRAARPRAAERHVEVVAAGLGRELGAGIV